MLMLSCDARWIASGMGLWFGVLKVNHEGKLKYPVRVCLHTSMLVGFGNEERFFEHFNKTSRHGIRKKRKEENTKITILPRWCVYTCTQKSRKQFFWIGERILGTDSLSESTNTPVPNPIQNISSVIKRKTYHYILNIYNLKKIIKLTWYIL